MSFRVLATALIVAVLTAGCSSSGALNARMGEFKNADPNKVAFLTVTSTQRDEDAQDGTNRLRSSLYQELVSQGVFKQVVYDQGKADFQLDVELEQVNEVSQAARILFGVFAGSNSLSARVKLTNLKTGETVSTFQVQGQSAAHPFSTEAGFEDAIREATGKIIQGLS